MRVLFLFYFALFIVINIQAQDVVPQSTGEKFNERGYLKSSSISSRGNEIISDYDGNVSIVYSSEIKAPNGLGGEITVTYNPNVEHRFFINGPSSMNRYGYPVNAPEWIIGYKGYALQTLNFEANFYSHKNHNPTNWTNMQGEETPLLIPGYHYCNKIGNTRDGQPEPEKKDYFSILMSDGSTKTFYNKQINSFLGTYLSAGYDDLSYAVAELKPGSPRYRRIYVKELDGLTYLFEEDSIHFYDFVPIDSIPKTIYLKKIISANGDTLTFDYVRETQHNFGKMLFWQMTTTKGSTFLDASFRIEYIVLASALRQLVLHNDSRNEILKFNINSIAGNSEWFNHDTLRISGINNTNINQIISVTDELNRTDYINYTSTYKNYQGVGGVFSTSVPIYLIDNILYSTGKFTAYLFLSHLPSTFYTYNLNDFQCSTFRMQTQRDCETNFILSQIIRKNKLNGVGFNYQTMSYDYGSEGGCNVYMSDNIWTEITTTNNLSDSSSPGQIKEKKYFNKYKVMYSVDFNLDMASTIKLKTVERKVNETLIYKKEINYRTGIYNSTIGGYSGDFLIENIIETTGSLSKTTGFAYTIQTVVFENAAPYFRTKFCVTTKTETDPYGLIKYETYQTKYPLPGDMGDPNNKYLFNIPGSVKVYKNNKVKTWATYSYNLEETSGLFGKLLSKTDQLTTSTVSYSYNQAALVPTQYQSIYPNLYKWHLKEVNNDSKNKIVYSYAPQVARIDSVMYDPLPKYKYFYVQEIQGKVAKTDETVVDSTIVISTAYSGYVPEPMRTDIIYNENHDTLSQYSVYDTKGNLRQEVNINKFYSEYNYDITGRIVKANLPGSFPIGNVEIIDTNLIVLNENILISRRIGIDNEGKIYSGDCLYDYGGEGGIEPDKFLRNDASTDGEGEPGEPGENSEKFLFDYWLLPEKINTHLIQNLIDATLSFHCGRNFSTQGQNTEIWLYAITDTLEGSYTCLGQKTIDFDEYSLIEVDVSDLIINLVNNNKDLYGFSLKTLAEGSETEYKWFTFPRDTIPIFSFAAQLLSIDTSRHMGSVLYTYDDENNKVKIQKRYNFDVLNPLDNNSVLYYDALSNLRKVESELNGTFVKKQESKFNYLGLNSEVSDGDNRKVFNKYDGLSRQTETRFIEDVPGSPKKSIGYVDFSSYETITETDEDNKIIIKELDKVGNLLKLTRGSLETNFLYNEIYQLDSVVSPMGKSTRYEYDSQGNISKKISPDEGTYNYKYSKYNQLRLMKHDSESFSQYITYDSLNRPIYIGKQSVISFSGFNPEGTPYWFEKDTAYLLVQNMYDKFYGSGAFAGKSFPTTVVSNTGNYKGRLIATAFRDNVAEPWNYKAYSYDHLGRVKTMWHYYNNTSKYVSNEYDHWGNLTKQCINGEFYLFYDYDEQGRLTKIWSSRHLNKTTAILEAEYYYNNSDQIVNQKFKNIKDYRNNINHLYNNRSWLDDLSYVTQYAPEGGEVGDPEVIFNENINYLNNGNIDSLYVNNLGNTSWEPLALKFTYDDMNRLTYQNLNSQNNQHFVYDNDGNITMKTHQSVATTIFYYPNGKNSIDSIRKDWVYYDFAADAKGNIVTDELRGININSLNYKNLPANITQGSQNIKYKYDENGQRIYKEIPQFREYYLRDHTGRELAIYHSDKNMLKSVNLYGSGMIGQVKVTWDSAYVQDPQGEWYWNYISSDKRSYYVKDHLGSIRLTFNEYNEVLNAQDYHPYGEVLRGYVAGEGSRYMFTEKERDTETSYDYFGARFYDSELGRWLSVDPLADKYPGWSPYNYTLNNPLKYIDPNGMDTLFFNRDGSYSGNYKAGGDYIGHILDSDGNYQSSFSFLDPADAVAIRDGKYNGDGFKITGINLRVDDAVDLILEVTRLAAKDLNPIAHLAFIATESQPGGLMDFTFHKNILGTILPTDQLALIGGMAYNRFDAGNYVWGAAMSKVFGFTSSQAQLAARIYERIFNNRSDQSYDQIAIWNGARRK